ncbi:hypothetical protein ABT158_18385 [Nonomuraea sp. NPDC001636]
MAASAIRFFDLDGGSSLVKLDARTGRVVDRRRFGDDVLVG